MRRLVYTIDVHIQNKSNYNVLLWKRLVGKPRWYDTVDNVRWKIISLKNTDTYQYKGVFNFDFYDFS